MGGVDGPYRRVDLLKPSGHPRPDSLIDAKTFPVAKIETSRKEADPTKEPSSRLIERAE